jgi:hypothetical protein
VTLDVTLRQKGKLEVSQNMALIENFDYKQKDVENFITRIFMIFTHLYYNSGNKINEIETRGSGICRANVRQKKDIENFGAEISLEGLEVKCYK